VKKSNADQYNRFKNPATDRRRGLAEPQR